jgi:exodeoxyribonuclease VII large subunit
MTQESPLTLLTDSVFSVTSLSAHLKKHIEANFSFVQVQGEVASITKHQSGHIYFSLRDEGAALDGICWRSQAPACGTFLKTGAEVICCGRLTSYPLRSKYQIIVESVQIAGEGALLKLLEETKRKLRSEGLFDKERKKNFPPFPQAIGIITSPTGAVIQDMVHRLEERFPALIYLWPVAVQGETAAREIARAVQGFNLLKSSPLPKIQAPDLLIIARGGGSTEDLWPFNNETLARTLAESSIPILTGVGHETDITLVDYVADHRAPTPSAAAEHAVPHRQILLKNLSTLEDRLRSTWHKKEALFKERLYFISRLWRSCSEFLNAFERRLDEVSLSPQHLRAGFQVLDARLTGLYQRLFDPTQTVARGEERLNHLSLALDRFLTSLFQTQVTRFDFLGRQLDSVSYKSVLKRGFCMVSAGTQPVTSSHALSPSQKIDLMFHDGHCGAVVTHKAPKT